LGTIALNLRSMVNVGGSVCRPTSIIAQFAAIFPNNSNTKTQPRITRIDAKPLEL
jgi:hypothetical protein